MRTIPFFKGSLGVNNKIDPSRIECDFETGMLALAEGINIDIDDSRLINRRKGTTATAVTDACHSLFSCGNYGLCVKGDALCIVTADTHGGSTTYSISGIRTVTENARMQYILDRDKAYYCNGYEIGYVQGGRSCSWEVPSYIGLETTRSFDSPVIGHNLEIYKGRMFIAQDRFLRMSEPMNFSSFDLNKAGFYFDSYIRMIKAVQGGLYVGTDSWIYFLTGDIYTLQGELPKRAKILNAAVIEGTDLLISGSKLKGKLPGMVNIFTLGKGEGICIGDINGSILNLTEERLNYPDARYGAAMFINGKYIVSFQA